MKTRKAEEYAKIYNEIPDEKTATEFVLYGLIDEIAILMKERKIQRSSGYVSIIKELNQKWNAIVRKTNGLREDGFIEYLKYICKREQNFEVLLPVLERI